MEVTKLPSNEYILLSCKVSFLIPPNHARIAKTYLGTEIDETIHYFHNHLLSQDVIITIKTHSIRDNKRVWQMSAYNLGNRSFVSEPDMQLGYVRVIKSDMK